LTAFRLSGPPKIREFRGSVAGPVFDSIPIAGLNF